VVARRKASTEHEALQAKQAGGIGGGGGREGERENTKLSKQDERSVACCVDKLCHCKKERCGQENVRMVARRKARSKHT